MSAVPGIWGIVGRAFLAGLAGFVLVPVIVFSLVLASGYLLDDRCGTPGDSGGCEMGAATIAAAMAMPGFALFFLVVLLRGIRRRGAKGR